MHMNYWKRGSGIKKYLCCWIIPFSSEIHICKLLCDELLSFTLFCKYTDSKSAYGYCCGPLAKSILSEIETPKFSLFRILFLAILCDFIFYFLKSPVPNCHMFAAGYRRGFTNLNTIITQCCFHPPCLLFIFVVKNHNISVTGGLDLKLTVVITPTEALSVGLK